jgi:hypothetical protein
MACKLVMYFNTLTSRKARNAFKTLAGGDSLQRTCSADRACMKTPACVMLGNIRCDVRGTMRLGSRKISTMQLVDSELHLSSQ